MDIMSTKTQPINSSVALAFGMAQHYCSGFCSLQMNFNNVSERNEGLFLVTEKELKTFLWHWIRSMHLSCQIQCQHRP